MVDLHIGSDDTGGDQGPRNRRRKCMESADSAVPSQLQFMIEMIDEKHTLCDCSLADYLEHEHYMNQSWDTR